MRQLLRRVVVDDAARIVEVKDVDCATPADVVGRRVRRRPPEGTRAGALWWGQDKRGSAVRRTGQERVR